MAVLADKLSTDARCLIAGGLSFPTSPTLDDTGTLYVAESGLGALCCSAGFDGRAMPGTEGISARSR